MIELQLFSRRQNNPRDWLLYRNHGHSVLANILLQEWLLCYHQNIQSN